MPLRALETTEDLAQVQTQAFLAWIMDQYQMPEMTRIAWADATLNERVLAMRQAAKELGFAVT